MVNRIPKDSVIILCTTRRDAYIINKLSKLLYNKKVVVLSFKSEFNFILDQTRINVQSSHLFLDKKSAQEIYTEAKRLSNNWTALGEIKNQLEFLGVSYIDSISLDLPTFFLKVLRDFEIIRKLITDCLPRKIICLNKINEFNCFEAPDEASLITETAEHLCHNFGIDFFVIPRENIPRKKINLKNFKWLTILLLRKIVNNYGHRSEENINILGYECYYFYEAIQKIAKDKSFNLNILSTPSKLILSEVENNSSFFSKINSIESFCDFKYYDRHLEEKLRIKRIWSKIIKEKKFTSQFNFQSINIWPIIEKTLGISLIEAFTRISLSLCGASTFLSKNRPDIFITWSDCISVNRSLVLFFKKRKVYTVIIQHGAILFPMDHAPIVSDKICIWSDYSKKWFLENDTDLEKLIVTGNPKFVDIKKDKKENLIRPSIAKFLDVKKKTILYASQYQKPYIYNNYKDEKMEIYNNLFSIVKSNSNFQLIIKLHPQEFHTKSSIINFKNTYFPNVPIFIVKSGRRVRDYINLCDLFIFPDSTSGIEGMFTSKNLIYLKSKDSLYNLPYELSGIHVATIQDLEQRITSLINHGKRSDDKQVKQFLSYYCGKLDGNSSTRIIDFLKSRDYN